MATPAVPAQFDESRRSSGRLPMAVPIVLRGKDTGGNAFTEKTHTALINRTGAKVLTKHSLALGARLEMVIPHRKRASWGTVAWLGKKKGEQHEAGIALDETDDFWGVSFPEDRPMGPAAQPESAGGSEPAPVLHPEAPQPAAGPAAPEPEAAPAAPELLMGSSDKLSNVLRELAHATIEESLGGVLEEVHQRAEEILAERQRAFSGQAEEELHRAVETALGQLEMKAIDVIARNQRAWEQTLHALGQAAEEQLRVRLAEYEGRLEASADKVRRELARKLAEAGSSLGRE